MNECEIPVQLRMVMAFLAIVAVAQVAGTVFVITKLDSIYVRYVIDRPVLWEQRREIVRSWGYEE